MPDNLDEPSHRLMRETAASPAFAAAGLDGGRSTLLTADAYYDLLTPLCSGVDIWTTRYLHVLDGIDDIVAWFRSTGLKPFLDALDAVGQERFIDAYRHALREAYPQRRDGRILLGMPRLFIVATRR